MRQIGVPLLCLAVLLATSCSAPTLPSGGSGGFIIHTLYMPSGGVIENAEFVNFNMKWQSDGANAGGSASPITNAETDDIGLWASTNGRAPAVWSFTWLNTGGFSQCASAEYNGLNVTVGKSTETAVECYYNDDIEDPATYAVHPNPLNIPNPPSQVSIQAAIGTFTSSYGMPVAQFFDQNGNVAQQQKASSISPNGAYAYFSTPDIDSIGVGTYAGVVSNAGPNGTLVPAISVYETITDTGGCNPNCPPARRF